MWSLRNNTLSKEIGNRRQSSSYEDLNTTFEEMCVICMVEPNDKLNISSHLKPHEIEIEIVVFILVVKLNKQVMR